jgi:hypothetical protein
MGPDAAPQLHGYILCDDCETLWLDPARTSKHSFADTEAPACPICQLPLFGPQARWATEADLDALGWREQCKVESMHHPRGTSEDLLDPEDLAVDPDAPGSPDASDIELIGYTAANFDHLTDVSSQINTPDESSEPRPGC